MNFSDIERTIFWFFLLKVIGRVDKTAFCLSREIFWDYFKKREQVHSNLADSGEKKQPTEGFIL